ncbi:MAG: hypothetical protein ABIR17_07530 [Pseudolysinimonas sp.]|uniref:hypothetical protein n=1 Tax=Pseudolysinimonas sp. TaxID=2680009 RepID=UPI003266577B
MFKKLIAGAATIALALGMVALTAETASAHSNDVSATVACNPANDGSWTVTWKITNDYNTNSIVTATSETGGYTSPVTIPTAIAKSSSNPHSATFTQNFATKPAGDVKLTVTSYWYDNGDDKSATYHQDNSFTIHPSDFSSDCQKVTPGDPTFNTAQCTGPGTYGTASYTVPAATTKYKYQIRFTSAGNSGWSDVAAAGVTNVAIAANGYVEVRAVTLNGWTLTGTTFWKKQFTAPDCTYNGHPTKPTIVQAVCTGDGTVSTGSYTIPDLEGVQYKISTSANGTYTDIAPAEYSATNGSTIYLRAYPKTGYVLDDTDANQGYKSFPLVFTTVDSTKCNVPTVPTASYQYCVSAGNPSDASYTIPTDTGIQYQIWNGTTWVNVGSTSSDTVVQVTTFPTQIKLQAVAKTGYTIPAGSTTSWTFDFATIGDCVNDATPVAPSWTDSVCEIDDIGATNPTFTVNGTVGDHLHYEVSTDSTNGVDGTWTSVPDGGPQLGAVGVKYWIKAVPDAGYKLVGATGPWSHLFTNPGDCLDNAAVADPFFVDEICTLNGPGIDGGYYTIKAGENAHYEISFDSTNGTDGTWNPVNPLTYGVKQVTNPSDHVWIRAIADEGFTLGDSVSHWDHQFAAVGDCLDKTPVKPAIVVDQICVVDDSDHGSFTSGSITPPTGTPHVTYSLGDDFATAVPLTAKVNVSPGTYTVWALADDGYTLDPQGGYVLVDPSARVIAPGQLSKQVVTIHKAEACGDLIEHPTVTPKVTFQEQKCAASGTYTLGVEETGLYAGIVWTITPVLSTSEGTHNAPTGAVHIEARPAAGYGFDGDFGNGEVVLTWDHVFKVPVDCLPTLAFTGGGIATGALGISVLLVLGGGLLVAARNRKVGMVKAGN